MASEYRTFAGEIRTLAKKNEFLYDVEIWLLNDKVNRNGWKYINIEANKAQFAGTPILVAYLGNGAVIGDGHNYKMVPDVKTKTIRPSFTEPDAERIVGSLSDRPEDIRMEERDGNKWVVGRGSLWRFYAPELVDKIENDAMQGHTMSISIETLVTKSHMEEDVEIEEEYQILGTTILGDHVMPAVEDARIVALSAESEEFKQLKMRAASYENEPTVEKKENEANDGAPSELNTRKGVNKLDILNRKQIAELDKRFEGYTVLSAAKSEKGIHVCLLSDNGETATYTLGDSNEAVVPDRIVKTNSAIVYDFGEDEQVRVDASEACDALVAKLVKANATVETLEKKVEEATEALESMRKAEAARRLQSARDMAKDTLDRFNANRADKVEESVIAQIKADVEKGVYANSVDADGVWCGDKAVQTAVLAACAAAVMEADQKAAEQRMAQYPWNFARENDGAADGGVGAMVKFLND